MMKLEVFRAYADDIVVHQDDVQFWKFYIIPGRARVRKNEKGDPVFIMVKYRNPDQARERDPSLPLGGGYLAFDAELMVEEDRRTTIVDDLQKFVKEEWQRRREAWLAGGSERKLGFSADIMDALGPAWASQSHEGGERASGQQKATMDLVLPNPGAVAPPKEEPSVIIAQPMWIAGDVELVMPQASNLVLTARTKGPASLVGNNTAVFAVDLTPEGATFFEQVLLDPDGSGGSDFAALQVVYNLTCLAKLPPATALIQADTARVYHSMQELTHEHTNCSDDYFTSEKMMTMAVESQMITVNIDAGGITDEDIIRDLQRDAQETAREWLTAELAEVDPEPLEEWANEDIMESSNEIYRLKQVTEVSLKSFSQTVTIAATKEHTVHPQGMIQTFFSDVSKSDMGKFVRLVDLDDPFFTTLALEARAFARWAEDEIDFVEVQIEYGRGADLRAKHFTFTAANAATAQTWDPFLIDEKREYRFRWRANFKGREAKERDWSKWVRDTRRHLNVSVETPGVLDVTVLGAGLNFEDVVELVMVTLRYGDRGNDIDTEEHSLLLAPGRLEGKWTRKLYAPWEKPIDYQVQYLLKNGTITPSDREVRWQSTEGPTRNLVIPPPPVDVLDVHLVPSGQWDNVVQAVVTVDYDGGGKPDFQHDKTFKLEKLAEFKTFTAILPSAAAPREYTYRILTTFKHGGVEEEVGKRTGDGPLQIRVVDDSFLEIAVEPGAVDFDATPLVKVTLKYHDPQFEPALQTEAFTFKKGAKLETWRVPKRENGPKLFTWQATFVPAQGDDFIEREAVTTIDPMVLLPRVIPPRVGASVRSMVNYEETPVVLVDLQYGEDFQTLAFEATTPKVQDWFVWIDEDQPREYHATYTYHLANGDVHTVGPHTLTKTQIILPRLRVQEAPGD
jgi:hypothetical protein